MAEPVNITRGSVDWIDGISAAVRELFDIVESLRVRIATLENKVEAISKRKTFSLKRRERVMAGQHTPGAMRAAEEIDRQIARQGDYTIENMTAIIDQETGLPEITAGRDRLKKRNEQLLESIFEAGKIEAETLTKLIRLEAEKAELVEAMQDIASTDKTMVEVNGAEATINHIIGWAKAALAKAEPGLKVTDDKG